MPMKASLSPFWELSTEHAASSYGQPVLVQRHTGQTFGPGDRVQLYPSYGYTTAAAAVSRFAKTAPLSTAAQALVARFVEALPPERPLLEHAGVR
jgi:hypothetical protein